MALEDILSSIKTGAYKIGGQAKYLTQQGIDLVSSYATYAHNQVQNNQTVMDYNQFANDHIKKLKLAGIVVADDLAKTGQDFMTHTITGQTITSWASQAQKKIVDTANDIDNQSGGFFSKNSGGLITAVLAFITTTFFSGNPLFGLLAGMAGGAAANYAMDKSGTINTALKQNTPDASHTPPADEHASTNTPAQEQVKTAATTPHDVPAGSDPSKPLPTGPNVAPEGRVK